MLQAPRARTRRRAVSSAAIAAIAASAGLAGAASLAAGPAAAAPASTARVGSLVLLPQGVRALGALSSSTQISVDVTLQPRDPAALTAFASAVSTPGSPLFREYLPKGAFAGRFGPTTAAISAVEASLRSEGLRPGAITSNHLIIPVTATAGQFAKAFSTSFERYSVGGRIAYANTRAPLFSASIARDLIGVVGLDNVYQPQHQSLLARVHAAATSTPVHFGKDASGPQACAQASGTASVYGAYTANELASAYGFTSLYSAGDLGAGQTIALFELEKNKASDIAAYQKCYGTSAKVTYVEVDGGSTGAAAGEGEAALDIEDLVGLAPKAHIEVYRGPNTNKGLLAVYNKIASDDTAKVMSSSWGECESQSGATLMNSENTIFEQAATQGQSLFAAAGDGGSTDCETNTGTIQSKVEADDPASQPYITGVGGTKLPKSGAEVVWNESSASEGAGGGGVSAQWKMPSYQSGAPKSLNVINTNSSGKQCKATSGDCREEPDVSANADPSTGYMIYYTGTAAGVTGWLPIGGTSAASPLWAALMALVNADSACKAPIGFTNPALYKVAATSYKTTFKDITSGNNDYTPSGYTGGLYPAGTAYDMASGLGSPKAGPLAAALCALGGSGGGKIKVTNPGTQTSAIGAKVSLPVKATDSTSGATLSYAATGLPAGLKIAATTGLITGSPTKKATDSVTVTVKDNKGVTSDIKFSWDIT
jgi:subtilase family serine protease